MVNITACRAPPSPRYLPHRHAKKLLAKRLSAQSTGDDEPETLAPGQERLYSYYLPSLTAGPHTISTTQIVTVGASKLNLTGTQTFTVVAPRYTLPDGSFHSVYPPQGHADNVEILPHIVLNDPHLPWERHMPTEDDKDHNRVPWIAVLVFTQEELRVTDQTIFEKTSLPKPIQQSTTLAVNMSLSDLAATKCTTPVLNSSRQPHDGDDPSTKADFIFVPNTLFNNLVTNYEKPQDQQNCSASRYKWLAHMRDINNTGMANSGMDEEEVGSFGIVMSHRTGPLSITQPTQVTVHVVSIENIEDLKFPVAEGVVGLCSLDSWSYTCLPPNSLNVPDAFRHLGETLSVLRPEDSLIGGIPPEGQRLADRLKDGYTITQYRTQTGEISAALLRGPFAPTLVRHDWKPMSNFGTDLQVMDKEIGIMDLTYSVAWQLGKTLALADQSFTTALGKIRIELNRSGVQKVKEEALRAIDAFQSRNDILRSLGNSINTLGTLQKDRLARGPVTRWRHENYSPVTLNFALNSDFMDSNFHEYTTPVAVRLASSTTEGEIYNEHNTPANPDWMVVVKWVLDRMYLSGIPAHYLIPDPSHLPAESLRFFHIDPNWIDAMIDGALSVANHMDNDDKIRTLIKEQINEYLKQPLAGLPYPPQIPTHGFLLRSELCTKFPDLIVEAPYSGKGTYTGALILRQENIDDGVILALFDRVPGSDDFNSLIFRQPPHQQSFAAGAKLDATHLETSYKRVYTIPFKDQPTGPERKKPIKTDTLTREDPEDPQSTFVWGDKVTNDIRTLRLPQWANDVYTTIRTGLGNDFQEDLPTAALVGIQLNNPMYFLEILLTERPAPSLSALSGDDWQLRGFKMLHPRSGKKQKKYPLSLLAEAPRSSPFCNSDFLTPLPTPRDRTQIAKSRGRHQKSQAQPSTHFRNLSTVADDLTATMQQQKGQSSKDPAGSPQFTYAVFRLGGSTTGDLNVPILVPPTPQDLVFRILLKDSPGEYDLQQILISIRLGPTKTPDGHKNLALNYRGPGSVMLSNLRFNVIPTFSEVNSDRRLVLKLLPRSTDGSVRLSLLEDLSFLLNGVVVNDYSDKDEGRGVKIFTDVTEIYVGFKIPLPDPLIITLVKEKAVR